jgi:hypothetical protein
LERCWFDVFQGSNPVKENRPSAVSRCGDEMMRAMLYEATQAMLLRSAKWSWLQALGDADCQTAQARF